AEAASRDRVWNRGEADRDAFGEKPHDLGRRLEDVGPGRGVAAMNLRERPQEDVLSEQIAVEENRAEAERFARSARESERALHGELRDGTLRHEQLTDARHGGHHMSYTH